MGRVASMGRGHYGARSLWGAVAMGRARPISVGRRRGLDNAGKTTLLKRFNGEDVSGTAPTLGFNIKTLQHRGFTLNVWDVGGQSSLRSYWRNYFESTDGVVWVVDSGDRQRLQLCAKELRALLREEVWGKPEPWDWNRGTGTRTRTVGLDLEPWDRNRGTGTGTVGLEPWERNQNRNWNYPHGTGTMGPEPEPWDRDQNRGTGTMGLEPEPWDRNRNQNRGTGTMGVEPELELELLP
ncbi:uncharacterized protein LOC110391835 [Numida meleagris]|uniref:uncharacterized protein LOC110391835 n=1 Tax=Numida meleagris TaxID=8996 RepID=UPI000B3DDB4C|nr:uncharacterized protein LOC110391835 [Numida meleagris]